MFYPIFPALPQILEKIEAVTVWHGCQIQAIQSKGPLLNSFDASLKALQPLLWALLKLKTKIPAVPMVGVDAILVQNAAAILARHIAEHSDAVLPRFEGAKT